VPGIGDIPFFGRLFRSRQISRNKTELLVLVTPEIVNPIPKGQPLPEIKMPGQFLDPEPGSVPRTPSRETTGESLRRTEATIPVEELVKSLQPVTTSQPTGAIQYAPLPLGVAVAPAAAKPTGTQ
jgi:pilus assembly protein CpaC